jgi:hypothetical protein
MCILPVQDGTCGQIRSWAAVGQDVVLVSMKGTRWCGNVGRHHKSNGIYYVVDLASGTWSDCSLCRPLQFTPLQ